MTSSTQGLITCSRYSFAPNSLHYCGPEKQADMLGYVTRSTADRGLVEILNQFDTLYKYLVLIASCNGFTDPFDSKVVEAYWLGNILLHKVKLKDFATHLTDTVELKKKLPSKKFSSLLDGLTDSSFPHHNFHVVNVFVRTGHHAVPHTLPTMDSCRIGWGKIVGKVKGKKEIKFGGQYVVETQPLIYKEGKLQLGNSEKKIVTSILVAPKNGQWVSLHWGNVCDVITDVQRKQLMQYTHVALLSANRMI